MSEDALTLAGVELLGALTYGQLRAHTAAVAIVPVAPDIRRADEVLAFADRERERYRMLRARLEELTDLPGPVLERQKPAFDAFFDGVDLRDWLGGVVLLAVGLPMAADFTRAVAPTVDERTGAVLLEALAGRARMEAFARDELVRLLEADAETAGRARRLVADVVGRALTNFTAALAETDALRVLFDQLAEQRQLRAESVVKRTAMEVLEAHRRRMLALGLDELD